MNNVIISFVFAWQFNPESVLYWCIEAVDLYIILFVVLVYLSVYSLEYV